MCFFLVDDQISTPTRLHTNPKRKRGNVFHRILSTAFQFGMSHGILVKTRSPVSDVAGLLWISIGYTLRRRQFACPRRQIHGSHDRIEHLNDFAI